MKDLMKKGSMLLLAIALVAVSCKKPADGIDGKDGADGTNGTDATVAACKECHNATVVEAAATQFELSKHSWGEAAFEEAGNASCAPCHESEGFKYVCANNTPATFTLASGVYTNNYAATATTAFGEITCNTCHSKLHDTYTTADLPSLTTTAAVPMTMWAGAKTINLTQDGGQSNLCVKCHQPRPFAGSTGTDKRVVSYDTLALFPDAVFYDSSSSATTNLIKPGYRTHTHYGTVGAVFAGEGGVEFTGAESYINSTHTTAASCQDCHMATMTGAAGGHTFKAKGNFNGCNATACHGSTPITSSSTTYWSTPRAAIKALLDQLAADLAQGGIEILNKNPDSEENLWYGVTTNNYDGYLNVYDPINNPNGPTNNTGQFRNPSTTNWTNAQKATNNALPKLTLTNAQMGAIINFQFCLREYSLGIHNYNYSYALLKNTIDLLESKK